MLLCFVIAGLLLRENTTAGAEEKLVFVTFLLFSCRSVVFISTCFIRFKRVFIVFWMVCFNKELVQREVFLTDPFKRWVRCTEEHQKSNMLGKGKGVSGSTILAENKWNAELFQVLRTKTRIHSKRQRVDYVSVQEASAILILINYL